jgi:hypothetical protein
MQRALQPPPPATGRGLQLERAPKQQGQPCGCPCSDSDVSQLQAALRPACERPLVRAR